jgi:hypothetical protein
MAITVVGPRQCGNTPLCRGLRQLYQGQVFLSKQAAKDAADGARQQGEVQPLRWVKAGYGIGSVSRTVLSDVLTVLSCMHVLPHSSHSEEGGDRLCS